MHPARPSRSLPDRRPRARSALLILLAALGLVSGCGFGADHEVLILTRGGDPVSAAIADYYADARGISAKRILPLPISGPLGQDEIDRETFQREIEAPIEAYLAEKDPDNEITIIVTTLGLPLRIGHCAANQLSYPLDCETAAVDAAIAGLGRISPASTALKNVENPFFLSSGSFADYRAAAPKGALRFLVARLTGNPMPRVSGTDLPSGIKILIDRGQDTAEASEEHGARPLWQIRSRRARGQRTVATAALLDPVKDRLSALGYPVCDGCDLPKSAPGGIVLQSTAGPDDTPTLSFPGLVIGLGALEASTRLDQFISEWTDRGAAAFSTHLADPSLAGVTRPAPQLESLVTGSVAIEAHFKSVPHLGWMNIFIGDPLLTLPHSTESKTSAIEVADRDQDGIPDTEDNCLLVPNPTQRDSDADQIGNRCDADVNNDGRVLTSRGLIYPLDQRGDLEAIALTAQNGPHNADHDLDGDGQVDQNDLALAQLWLFRPPGPSGRAAPEEPKR